MLRYIVRRAAGAAMDRKGVTAAEYAILAVGVVIVVGTAVSAFGGGLTTAFQAISGKITSTQNSIGTTGS